MSDSIDYVNIEYLRKVTEEHQKIKDLTYNWMNLKLGHNVLDLGCGPGIDTIALAKLVGPNGTVIGIDNDEKMIRVAEEDTKKENLDSIIKYKLEDATKLQFKSNFFDSCRAERFFQILPHNITPEDVINEIYRVLCVDGWIVLADSDWGSISIDFSNLELERRLTRFFAEKMRPNGFAGRQFLKLLKFCGFKDIKLKIAPMMMNNYSESPFADWLCKEALTMNIASEHELDIWRKSLENDSNNNLFYACVNMIVIAGRK